MKYWYLKFLFLFAIATNVLAQQKFEFDGQASVFGSFSPDNKLSGFVGGRYIPRGAYSIKFDSTRLIDFEASANIYGSSTFHPFDSSYTAGDIQPYRIWARYSGKQFEIRVGLQKIDFGSATLLRPLQWFNQVDPRDPLKLTNGVYGVLGRYYFLNNANIWLWTLYGNEKPRGFDAIGTYKKDPEYGGRIQYPVTQGEIAISYHHRTADTRELLGVPSFAQIPEDRIGLDGKWDVGVGLWFEASYIHKGKQVGTLTNQTLLNVGTDYTFDIGSGLNVVVEHLIIAYDNEPFAMKNNNNITATMLSYPVGLFDNLSAVFNYNWETSDISAFLNYSHQFRKVTGYVMAYYNPTSQSQQGIQKNDLVNAFSGPGIRLMIVYNH